MELKNIKKETDFNSLLEKERVKINDKLSSLLKNTEPKSLYEPCQYILDSGGKRLRPLLVLLSAKAAGGKFQDAYNAALAVEIFHNFTLVHDDIMDNAEKRRGRPTLHVRNDLSTAILAGDNLVGVAYNLLLKDVKSGNINIVKKFTRALIEVCEGQSYDKDFELKKSVTLDEYKLMIQKKTAALLELCCSIGAEIGNGDKEVIKALEQYGRNLGMAFQVEDDLLDILADEKDFGKQIGRDLMEGKKTFLFLKALEKSTGKTKTELEKVIKNKGIEKEEVNKYYNIYKELGIIEETEKAIVDYTQKALKPLAKIKDEESRKILEWLACDLIKRKK